MSKPEPATAPRIVSGRMVPYETAREAVSKSCPDADINGWLTSFTEILIAADNTTWDRVGIDSVVLVLEGLIRGIRARMAEQFEEAMKIIEEA